MIALCLRASRGAVCSVAFSVLLTHARQLDPEYSGARENPVRTWVMGRVEAVISQLPWSLLC